MFLKNEMKVQYRRDFRVGFAGDSGEKARVVIGPRFRPQYYSQVTNPGLRDNLTSQSPFSFFYSPETWDNSFAGFQAAVLIYQNLKNIKKESEISKFCPVRISDDWVLADGGEFEIPKGELTYFWMKIPSGLSVSSFDENEDYYTRLTKYYPMLEFGSTIPENIPSSEDGEVFSTFYIPVLSIIVNQTTCEIKYYELGEIRYFSDQYEDGEGNQKIFYYDTVSEFYDEPP